MSLSMYQASVPYFIRELDNLAVILKKGATHAEAKKIDAAVLVNARLYPDMFPLSRQVQIATDLVRGAGARLAAVERPVWQDNEVTFDDLLARVENTVQYLKGLKPAQIDGSEERKVTVPQRDKELHFKGQDYLFGFAWPNFYFHMAMTYAILRHNGVELGKMDFIGAPPA